MSVVAAGCLLAGLVACAEFGLSPPSVPQPTGTTGSISASAAPAPVNAAVQLTPQENPAPANAKPTPQSPPVEIFRGTGQFVNPPRPTQKTVETTVDGNVSLNFLNADIHDVIKTVLDDFLKLTYVIDPGVQGTVTLQTAQPIKRDDVLAALEMMLRLNNAAIVQSNGIYHVVSVQNAPRTGSQLRAAQRGGYALQIVPLRYVGVEEMQRILEPLAPAGSIVRADRARNLLILGGDEAEQQILRDTIATFDVDWLAGMSFALLPVKKTEAKAVADELGQIIGGANSPIAGLIRISVIERMNALLVVSPQPAYLDTVQQWVNRLDQGENTADKRIYVYPVQNGRASDLAAVLTKSLGKGGGGDESAGQLSQGGFLPPYGHITIPPVIGSASPPAPSQAEPAPNAQADSTSTSGASDGSVALTGIQSATITADETNNALVITATPSDYATIEAALKKLDITPLQVFIEAAIVEVELTNDLRYGVQYFFQTGNHQLLLSSSDSSSIAAPLPGFSYLFSGGANIKVVLDALESVTKVNVISSPELMVLNNRTATLQVGDQVPIATESAVSVVTTGAPVVNSIQYRDTGVILKVTPRVNAGGLVMLEISQEVSDVSPTSTSTLNSPTITERKVNSIVAVQSGETVALGGLIKEQDTSTQGGIPGLQKIPLLGALFSNTSNHKDRTELVVMLTPHVIHDTTDAKAIVEEMKRKLPLVAPLSEQLK